MNNGIWPGHSAAKVYVCPLPRGQRREIKQASCRNRSLLTCPLKDTILADGHGRQAVCQEPAQCLFQLAITSSGVLSGRTVESCPSSAKEAVTEQVLATLDCFWSYAQCEENGVVTHRNRVAISYWTTRDIFWFSESLQSALDLAGKACKWARRAKRDSVSARLGLLFCTQRADQASSGFPFQRDDVDGAYKAA